MFRKITLAIAVAVAGLVSVAAAPQIASADHGRCSSGYSHSYVDVHAHDYHVCQYKTIVTYVYKTVPYKKKIVLYHPCGTPYYVWKTYWKTIKVPVYKTIKVCGCGY